MPIHDWTSVSAGTFHDFHLAWIAELRRALNAGLLPPDYYALAERVAGPVGPDVLTLQDVGNSEGDTGGLGKIPAFDGGGGGLALATRPPRASVRDTVSEAMLLAARRRRLVIRHQSGDRIVALIEVVSPGNKEKRGAVDMFVDKAIGALDEGYHLLILDLLPPRSSDPFGMHGAIWSRLGGTYHPPADKPLTLAAYTIDGPVTCYVEPVAVRDELIEMPLFLDPGHYVNVPLELTYLAAYEGVPQRWKRVIEAAS